jgi:threonine/homoserine/homoserine lactone efflux protein
MSRSIAAALPAPLLATTIHWRAIAPLVLAAAAIMGSPGPATISLAAAGSAYGVRRSLVYLTGIVVGTTLVLLAVAAGITTTLLALPALRVVLISISSVYILWLAYRVATAPPLGAQTSSRAVPALGAGTVLGFANPKAWVAIAAVFASSRLADDAATDAVAKTVVLAGMIVVILAAWLIAGASLAPVLRDPRRARIVNVVLAAALVGATTIAILH